MPKASITNAAELPEILTVDHMQQFLGISRPKAYALVNTATFPTVRIGRAIRVSKMALLRWLEQEGAKNKTS